MPPTYFIIVCLVVTLVFVLRAYCALRTSHIKYVETNMADLTRARDRLRELAWRHPEWSLPPLADLMRPKVIPKEPETLVLPSTSQGLYS